MLIAVNTRFLTTGMREGYGWYIHEVGRRLVEKHPNDEFLFLFDRPFDRSVLFRDDIHAEVVSPPARHPFLWYAWFELGLPKVFRKYRPDVFYSPDGYMSLSAKVPTLVTIHDVLPLQLKTGLPLLNQKYYERFVPRFAKKAARITTVSEHAKRSIVELCHVDANKIDVVYPGSRSIFQPQTDDVKGRIRDKYTLGKQYFMFTGAIHPRKNVAMLISAFDVFKTNSGSDFKLVLAGRRGWHNEDVDEALRKSKHTSDVIFLDYLDDTELALVTASANALFLISKGEGFGSPLVEAMHTDTPIVTSKFGAVAEVAGDAGILVDHNDVYDVARAMEEIATNQPLRNTLIERMRIRRTAFSWDNTADVINKALMTVARGT